MTPSDWLYEVREELLQVQSDNQVFTVGVEGRTGEVEMSITLTEQSDCIEAYVVGEPVCDAGIDEAINAVDEVTRLVATEEHKDRSVGTERDNKWAEIRVEVDPESVESL